VPLPAELELEEREVERLAVRLFGIRQGSIHVENQRFEPFHREISHCLRKQTYITREA
jgi:hypothetical protein